MLPSETMIWQPEFTDKTLSRKPGAVHTVFLKKGSFASRKTDDMLLLQETERALADKSSPKVIFL
ncbi:hypothetical protein NX020_28180, partial [Escherichia coli]|nr:hypothetical protein [Escherichia coli]